MRTMFGMLPIGAAQPAAFSTPLLASLRSCKTPKDAAIILAAVALMTLARLESRSGVRGAKVCVDASPPPQ
jgi:hypothetical protein